MGDPSIILMCLVFFVYPFAAGEWVLIGIASACLLAGAATEYALLRRKKVFWIPMLCVGAEVVLEVMYQLARFRIFNVMKGHAVWEYVFFGVMMLYVLLGALAAWGFSRSCIRKRRAS